MFYKKNCYDDRKFNILPIHKNSPKLKSIDRNILMYKIKKIKNGWVIKRWFIKKTVTKMLVKFSQRRDRREMRIETSKFTGFGSSMMERVICIKRDRRTDRGVTRVVKRGRGREREGEARFHHKIRRKVCSGCERRRSGR